MMLSEPGVEGFYQTASPIAGTMVAPFRPPRRYSNS
jgi:hypothetical protein